LEVLSIDTSMGEGLQVVPTSESVCRSPSGVIYVLHVRDTRTKEVEVPRLTAVWTAKRMAKEYSWIPVPYIKLSYCSSYDKPKSHVIGSPE